MTNVSSTLLTFILFKKMFFARRTVCEIHKIVKLGKPRQTFSKTSCCMYSEIGNVTGERYRHYMNLTLPQNKIIATYVWIDGSGVHLRSKNRILNSIPCNLSSVPEWNFDGSSTGQAKTNNSDTILVPSAIYKDPFRLGKHVIILCETYNGDGTPTSTNHRAKCARILSDASQNQPWFGIEQEYTMFGLDMWPLDWPQVRGYPAIKHRYSYCGVGTGHVVGRDVAESHGRACIFAGLDYGGSNAEVMKSSWEYQIGISVGIKAADDLWMGRYILNRVAEDFRVIISYHPKPLGSDQPGIGCHHNYSDNKMRSDGGITALEEACRKLENRHDLHMSNYGLGSSEDNRKRLTGKFETGNFDKFTWGIADRSASVRIQRSVAVSKKGFLEDRRPAGDCDPYRVCALLVESCS